MKVRLSTYFLVMVYILMAVSLFGQICPHFSNLEKAEHSVICEYELYKDELNSYKEHKMNQASSLLYRRSSSPNMDIRIYIDTSYERRRTGGYNNNDSVVDYLDDVVNEIQNAFNLAAPNWDIIIEPEYVFFDGATPFSYGSSTAETLINFYDWVDSQGYPGTRDTYVFYSGQYTNQGVAFLGSLCLPGGAMVGYVLNQDSNEDLSSHEWVGHCADSPHFNTEVNIMNSVAQRPWNQPSIDIIEAYLDNHSCVLNVQGSLSVAVDYFAAYLEKGKVLVNWKIERPYKSLRIERKYENQVWERIFEEPITAKNLVSSFTDQLYEDGNFYYRLVISSNDGSEFYSEMKHVYFPETSQLLTVSGNIVTNKTGAYVRVIDIFGRLILTFDDPEYNLYNLKLSGTYVLYAGNEIIRIVL